MFPTTRVGSGEKKSINPELWQACAGPLVNLPPAGTLVVYFPQGHSEQVRVVWLTCAGICESLYHFLYVWMSWVRIQCYQAHPIKFILDQVLGGGG